MSNINKLKFLINLVGAENKYSCNVSIHNGLDTNAASELNMFQKSRDAGELAMYEGILHEKMQCLKENGSEPSIWIYATNVFGILLQICDELEKNDDFPISIIEAKKVHIGIRKCIEYGMKPFLLGVATPIDHRLPYIVTSASVMLKIANNKFFPVICTHTDQHLVYTDLLSCIFTIISYANEDKKLQFEHRLDCVRSKLSHGDYFKILFLIKGSNQNRPAADIQQIVSQQLMQSLRQPGSFKALCEALLPSITSLDKDEEIVKKRLHCCAVISSILAKPGHKKSFYLQIIDEIHQHSLCFIRSSKSHQLYFTDVGVQCLSKLYSLNLGFIRAHIREALFRTFDNLANPNDLIAGVVVCESNELLEASNLVHLIFCASGPSDNTLPSEMLTPFMPMFFQIHHILNESTNKSLKKKILAIIVRCLTNREKTELYRVIEWILYEKYDENVKYLHQRMKVECVNDGKDEIITFNIATNEMDSNATAHDLDINLFLQPSTSLVNVLKQCNHNTLIYNIFVYLLQMFSENFGPSMKWEQSSSSCELLGSEYELNRAIEVKFKKRYAVIHALNELILFKPFHGQFTENPHDIVSTLYKILNQQMEQIKAVLKRNKKLLGDDCEEILMVILSIVGDFMLRMQNGELKLKLERTLTKLKNLLDDTELSTVVRKLNTLLGPSTNTYENSQYLEARTILSETHSEPYTKVYGIMNMIKLVNAKDEETCLNAHIVLALAMRLLKDDDSYIFLNCIKLLITLVDILEETVLETLIAEYHFDIDVDSSDIDFKLKVGETIVKVTQGLGGMCYKYKSILINCFLRGAHNKNNEFRTSNLSNLGVVVRILSYQVHNFFQEVILLIQDALQFDKYLPTRRAAALILSDLLKGIQNLEQFQDFLLPIYRIMKNIAESDSDLHMQIHARNALDCLKDKIIEAFTAEIKIEKEIQMFDVKNDKETIRFK